MEPKNTATKTISSLQEKKNKFDVLQELAKAFAGIRISRLRYMLLFALAPIFPGVKLTLPFGQTMLGMHPVFAMGIAFSLGAALGLFPIRLQQLHKWAKALSVALLVMFSLYLFPIKGLSSNIWMLCFGFVFGVCAAISLFGFSYALTAFEQFIAVLLTALFSMVAQMFFSLPMMHGQSGIYYLFAQVFVTALCLFFYRPADYAQKAGTSTKPVKGKLILSCVFFLFHRSVVFFYSYLHHLGPRADIALSGMVVILLSLFAYFIFRFSIWHLCNLFFVGMIAAYGLRLLIPGKNGILTGDFFYSFSVMGFIASYYLAAQTFSGQADYKTFRKTIAVLFSLALIPHIVPSVIANTIPQKLPIIGVGVTSCLLLLFVLLTPAFASTFSTVNPLLKPSAKEENEEKKQAEEARLLLLETKGLTAREKEVAELLFQGYFYKECADRLGISVETVKFHSRNLYRKLGIIGRNELALFFQERGFVVPPSEHKE